MFVRDGRDVAVSLRKRYGEFETALRRWVDDNSLGLNWSDDSRVMKVRYEDMVKKHDETMPRICKFIGEAFEEGLLNCLQEGKYAKTFYRQSEMLRRKGPVAKPSQAMPIQPAMVLQYRDSRLQLPARTEPLWLSPVDEGLAMKMFVDAGSIYLHRDVVNFRKSVNGLIVVGCNSA